MHMMESNLKSINTKSDEKVWGLYQLEVKMEDLQIKQHHSKL